MMTTTNKRRSLTIGEKIKIIERLESGASNKVVGNELLISHSTVSTIWKSRHQIKDLFQKDITSTKKIKSSQHKDVEDALLEWYKIQRINNVHINGPILQEKATEFGKLLNKPNFECSASWISRFRQRHNIAFGKKLTGSEAADISEINWLGNVWPMLRQKFSDSNIYNAEETGLFFGLTPDQTVRFRGEKCQGGELAKDRLTVLVASNMTGSDKQKLLIIGKSKACFKNVKNLPITYKNNKRAWMTGDIFTEWLHSWDDRLIKEKRKILLIVYNCPAHPNVANLTNITVVFLPTNTTSVLQPMKQGIFEAFKVKFRKRQLLKIINQEEQCQNANISLLDTFIMLADAWKGVTAETIKNCFRHAGFRYYELMDEEDPFLENLADWCNNLNQEIELIDLADVDKDLATYGTPTDEGIVHCIANPSEDESSEMEAEEPEEEIASKVPTISEVFFSIDQIRKYLCTNIEIDTPEISTALQKLENHVSKEYCASKCRQPKITDYFFKEK